MTSAPRSQQVDRSRVQAQLSVQELWLHYISLSGIADLLEVDAYLHGVFTLGSYQEDKLSFAVNAELDQRHQAARLPYTHLMEPTSAAEDPLDILRRHPVIADVRTGHGDDLSFIGRIRKDFLIPGHGRVKDHFADRLAFKSECAAFEHLPVRQC